MNFLSFYIGFVWALVAIGSVFLVSLYGVDRDDLKKRIKAFWNQSGRVGEVVVRRLLIVMAMIGFVFPVLYPVWGFVIAGIFLVIRV
ncbi:hypothetical protein [Paracidovorax anthurii]|uniref:hypothetical protein n=1 Tax=Paracidovorax anthurii TaxID=78229 RepID=UPI0011BD602C|nr:hypothetical protein [Paracidovorax anthurii]